MIKINGCGSTGITTIILLISFLLIGATVASIITGETEGTTSEEDMDQILNDVLDEITTYIHCSDGFFYEIYQQIVLDSTNPVRTACSNVRGLSGDTSPLSKDSACC